MMPSTRVVYCTWAQREHVSIIECLLVDDFDLCVHVDDTAGSCLKTATEETRIHSGVKSVREFFSKWARKNPEKIKPQHKSAGASVQTKWKLNPIGFLDNRPTLLVAAPIRRVIFRIDENVGLTIIRNIQGVLAGINQKNKGDFRSRCDHS